MKKIGIILGTIALSLDVIGLANTGSINTNQAIKPASHIINEKNGVEVVYKKHEYGYMGLEMGASLLDTNPESPLTWEEIATKIHGTVKKDDGWNSAFRLFGGYMWLVSSKFDAGIELGISRLSGNRYDFSSDKPTIISSSHLVINQWQIDLLGVAKYNFTKNFNVFAKAGAAYAWQRYSPNSFFLMPLPELDVWLSGFGNALLPKIVIGTGYDFNAHFGMTLSYSHLFGNSDTGIDRSFSVALPGSSANLKVTSSDSVMIGLIYRWF